MNRKNLDKSLGNSKAFITFEQIFKMKDMKRILYLLIAFTIIFFTSCSDNNNGSSVKLTAKFSYVHDGISKPSAATEMFIFKITNETSPDLWTFNKVNKYFETKDGKAIYPFYKFKANNNGIIEQNIENNTSYKYVYIPVIDPEVWGMDSFATKGEPVFIEKIHGLSNHND